MRSKETKRDRDRKKRKAEMKRERVRDGTEKRGSSSGPLCSGICRRTAPSHCDSVLA